MWSQQHQGEGQQQQQEQQERQQGQRPAPLRLRAVDTHPTDWHPSQAHVALNVRLDAAIVPSACSPGGARVSYGHVVVLDGLLPDGHREQLLEALTAPGWSAGPNGAAPPASKWERCTADGAGLPATWGLRPEVMRALLASPPEGMLELQSRLARLYPESHVCHMPADAMQARQPQDEQQQQGEQQQPEAAGAGAGESAGGGGDGKQQQQRVHCGTHVANAAVYGDCFRWHVDADPAGLPGGSAWHAAFGDFFSGEPGKPLLVSALAYLDAKWPPGHDAETLFLDAGTGTGVLVRPRPGRVVLMDQDVTHRLSTPSQTAGAPRYSLVWKLALVPREPGAAPCIARREWGAPADFGSAARMAALRRQLTAGSAQPAAGNDAAGGASAHACSGGEDHLQRPQKQQRREPCNPQGASSQ